MSKRKWNNTDLIGAVKNNEHITSVLKTLGLRHSSLNANTVRKYIVELKLDTSHWKDQIIKNRNGYHERSVDDIFIEDSTYTKSHLRDKIIKYQLLDYRCSKCGLDNNWNGKTLVLQVDHINGNNTDHRIENLRFLCPNCHSQTSNYAGANALNRKEAETFCCKQCGEYRSRVSKSGLCTKCFSTQDRVSWPDDATLAQMLQGNNVKQVAARLGVSAPGLKKRLQKKNIIIVPL